MIRAVVLSKLPDSAANGTAIIGSVPASDERWTYRGPLVSTRSALELGSKFDKS